MHKQSWQTSSIELVKNWDNFHEVRPSTGDNHDGSGLGGHHSRFSSPSAGQYTSPLAPASQVSTSHARNPTRWRRRRWEHGRERRMTDGILARRTMGRRQMGI